MWECKACFRRWAVAVARDLSPSPLLSTTKSSTTGRIILPHENPSRSYTTRTKSRNPRADHAPSVAKGAVGQRPPFPPRSNDAVVSSTVAASVAAQNKYKGKSPQEPLDSGPLGDRSFTKADIEKELKWVKHPVKLANRTMELLRQGSYPKAKALVVMASGEDIQCTVSWNLLVDYDMARGTLSGAVKSYNEMKKRGQKPDAHTYGGLFKGFAQQTRQTGSLEKALAIFHSMFAPTSTVKPNIIHFNSMLKICAQAADIDALMGVASRMPEKGKDAPDAWSYAIIMNALSQDLRNHRMKRSPDRATAYAYGVWSDVVRQWKKGDIRLDEKLVCAMGRLLLEGKVRDILGVIKLCHQTMGTPILLKEDEQLSPMDEVPRIWKDESPRPAAIAGRRNAITGTDMEGSEVEVEEKVTDQVDSDTLLNEAQEPSGEAEFPGLGDEALPDCLAPPKDLDPSSLVKPGCNTLSLLMEACRRLGFENRGVRYYKILTEDGGVFPDNASRHEYLRLLRQKRQSRDILETVRTMVKDQNAGVVDPVAASSSSSSSSRPQSLPRETFLQRKTFRIATSGCLRNIKSPHALDEALEIGEIMNKTLDVVDFQALGTIVRFINLKMAQTDEHRRQRSLDLVRAEQIAHDGWVNLSSAVNYATADPAMRDGAAVVARELLTMYDMLKKQNREDKPGINGMGQRALRIRSWLHRYDATPTEEVGKVNVGRMDTEKDLRDTLKEKKATSQQGSLDHLILKAREERSAISQKRKDMEEQSKVEDNLRASGGQTPQDIKLSELITNTAEEEEGHETPRETHRAGDGREG